MEVKRFEVDINKGLDDASVNYRKENGQIKM